MPRGVYDREKAPEAAVEAPTAALSARAQETRRERRSRDDGDLDRNARMKLAIPPDVQDRLKREGKTARWVLDDKNRLDQVHRQDWDVTDGVAPVPSGNDGLNLVLHEKYDDWHEERQAAKRDLMKKRDKMVQRGEIAGSGDSIEQTDFNKNLAAANVIR